MTAPRHKPYPTYKDSGVEWLGEIPTHWEVKPLKAVSGLQTGLTLGAVRPRRDVLRSRFLAFAMSSGYGRAYFTATSNKSTNLASTNSTKLRNLPMLMPALAEQDEVVLGIGRETARIDALIAMVHDAIDRLEELRTVLISAAVTGKIDVRGEVA